MSHLAPVVGSVVVFVPGRNDRVGGYAPHPAMINSVDTSGGKQTVTLTAFLSNGSTTVRGSVLHELQWKANAGTPYFDSDLSGYWRWPGAGQDDALAPGEVTP